MAEYENPCARNSSSMAFMLLIMDCVSAWTAPGGHPKSDSQRTAVEGVSQSVRIET